MEPFAISFGRTRASEIHAGPSLTEVRVLHPFYSAFSINIFSGISFTFGPSVVEEFCNENGVEIIIRAHQILLDVRFI